MKKAYEQKSHLFSMSVLIFPNLKKNSSTTDRISNSPELSPHKCVCANTYMCIYIHIYIYIYIYIYVIMT